jgi:cytochrome P450
MLATIFDFPFEERSKLTRWSDVAGAEPGDGRVESHEQRVEELMECASYFMNLYSERLKQDQMDEERPDLLSMLARSPATRNMPPDEFLGNIILLIVGGNDTTRNSITGGVLALNMCPDQYAKLTANPGLIPSLVPEIIRWQSPIAHMARTALNDTELGGKTIHRGDRVAMWYLSGNRDDDQIDRPHELIIDRPNPRQHLSFGYGIHRCVGNRLAELQLRVLWEEILPRFKRIEVTGEPQRVCSNVIHGYESMPVRVYPN